MIKITYHTDANSRKGCHPVTLSTGREKKGEKPSTIFLVDEPGAWFEDKWNCHVDGTDYPFKSRENAIIWGLTVRGILDFEEEDKERDERMNTLVEKCVEQLIMTGE